MGKKIKLERKVSDILQVMLAVFINEDVFITSGDSNRSPAQTSSLVQILDNDIHPENFLCQLEGNTALSLTYIDDLVLRRLSRNHQEYARSGLLGGTKKYHGGDKGSFSLDFRPRCRK